MPTTPALIVDLSNNNGGSIDFRAMSRAGVFGVMHKVSEGVRFVDQLWTPRSHAARAAGLHVGGYHFARPTLGTADDQAELFARSLGDVVRRDLHPALDLETDDGGLTPKQLYQWAHDFGEKFHELTGQRVMWYTGPAFIKAHKIEKIFGNGAGLWLADWGPNDGTDHGISGADTAPWHKATMHQFTSVGRVSGVAGRVDLNHARSRVAILAHGRRGT